MFITKEELQTAIYEYQVAEIMEGDADDIALPSPQRCPKRRAT